MADTETPARTALYAVVFDGHTADETLAGWALPDRFASRDEAIVRCDRENELAEALGIHEYRLHVEFLG